MEGQGSFAASEDAHKKKITRREKFLAEMEPVVPWARLVALLQPHYPKGARGRPPMGVERMLRRYFLQQWEALADAALEDALYDSQALRSFAGLDLGHAAVPAATTLLKFRRLLERHALPAQIFAEVAALLAAKHLLLREGTIVDATIRAAPSSTKNATRTRAPEMHQTKKGNQWYFGMKAHLGADAHSGLIHSLSTSAAHVADVPQVHTLLHGEEQCADGDAAYQGAAQRPEVQAQHPQGEWHIAAKRGPIKALAEGLLKELHQRLEKAKAPVRALVEHPFHTLKNVFGYRKVRYRGLAKNTAQLQTPFALVNLDLARRALLASTPQ